MRRMTADPAHDSSRGLQERLQYMPSPTHDSSARAGSSDPNTPRTSATVTDWLPYKSSKEKLASWVTPNTNDCAQPRNLFGPGSVNGR